MQSLVHGTTSHVGECVYVCVYIWYVFLSIPVMYICAYVYIYIHIDVCLLVQLLSHVQLFMTPWTAACQASLSITNSWSLFKLMSIESVMPSNHLILCHPLLLLPSIFDQPQGLFK